MRRFLVALALLVPVATAASWLDSYAMDVESHSQKRIDAQRLFNSGWLPAFLPETAFDIWELHNLDTNRTWACFSAKSGAPEILAALSEAKAVKVPGPVDREPPSRLFVTRSWWPSSMGEAHLDTYEIQEQYGFALRFGIDPRSSRACFSRGPRGTK